MSREQYERWKREVSARPLKCDECESTVEVGALIIGYNCGKHGGSGEHRVSQRDR